MTVLDETFIDLGWIFQLAPMLQAVGAKVVLPFTKESFHQLLQRQLDFKWEAYNLCRFARNFAIEQQKSKDTVRFPRVSPKLLSDTVLVETWAEGRTVAVLYQVQYPRTSPQLDLSLYLT